MDIINYSKIKKVENDLNQHKQEYSEQRQSDKLKVTSIEKELNDYKKILQEVNVNQEAKQSVTGFNILNLPKNSANNKADVNIKGNTYINILGSDGQFDTLTMPKRLGNGSVSLDNTTKLFGENSLKIVSAVDGFGEVFSTSAKYKLQAGKFYFASAYIKGSENAVIPDAGFRRRLAMNYNNIVWADVSSNELNMYISSDILKSNVFNRVGFKLMPAISGLYSFGGYFYRLNAQINIDGVQVVEITQEEYNNLNIDELMAKYPYVNGLKSTLTNIRILSNNRNSLDGMMARAEYMQDNAFFTSGSHGSGNKSNIFWNNGKLVINLNNVSYYGRGFVLPTEIGQTYTFGAKGEKNAVIWLSSTSENIITDEYGTWYWEPTTTGSYRTFVAKTKTLYVTMITQGGVGGTLWDFYFVKGNVVPVNEPYKESIKYIIKYISGNTSLMSLPSGTKDEIKNGQIIKKVNKKTLQANDVLSIDTSLTNVDIAIINKPTDSATWTNQNDVILYNSFYVNLDTRDSLDSIDGFSLDIANQKINYYVAKGTSLEDAKAIIAGKEIGYPLLLATTTNIDSSGDVFTYPNGTIYLQNAVADAGIYTTKLDILNTTLPIVSIEKISKIDYQTGVETELNPAQAVINANKLSFTHPSLSNGDIVFFTYFYPQELSTSRETTVIYYDSRYTIKDKVNNKFYKWDIEVNNGVPSIVVSEV